MRSYCVLSTCTSICCLIHFKQDGPEVEATPESDPAVPDNVEEPTDPAATAEPINPVVEEKIAADVENGVKALSPTG